VIAFIHGPDRLLARNAAIAHARGIDPDGLNTTWIDAREAGKDQLIGAIGAASFFGEPRVVIATGFLGRTSRAAQSGAAATSRAAGADAELKALIATVPEQNVLILFEPELDAAPSAIKSAKPSVTIMGGEPPRAAALLHWIGEAAERAGASIDRRGAQLLAETLFPQTWERKPANPRYDRPPDMALVTQEVEKLALAAYPDAISPDHILAMVPGGPDQRVFRFLDAATAGDLRNAHGELDRLLAAGEEPAMLLAQLLGQVELMAVASAAARPAASTLSRDLGSVTPSRMSAISSSAQRRRLSAADSLAVGAGVDRGLKTGRLRRPEDALLRLMLDLAGSGDGREPGRSR
jgi:DNA polymerase III delta subunit